MTVLRMCPVLSLGFWYTRCCNTETSRGV